MYHGLDRIIGIGRGDRQEIVGLRRIACAPGAPVRNLQRLLLNHVNTFRVLCGSLWLHMNRGGILYTHLWVRVVPYGSTWL